MKQTTADTAQISLEDELRIQTIIRERNEADYNTAMSTNYNKGVEEGILIGKMQEKRETLNKKEAQLKELQNKYTKSYTENLVESKKHIKYRIEVIKEDIEELKQEITKLEKQLEEEGI